MTDCLEGSTQLSELPPGDNGRDSDERSLDGYSRKMMKPKRPLGAFKIAWILALGVLYGCSPETGKNPMPKPPVSASTAAEKTAAPPSLVVVISLDTLRADHLGMYGAKRFTSPTLDQFADGGTVFTDASSTSPWTLPAHASMLTGLYPVEHRVMRFDSALPEDVGSLALTLKQNGYQTAAVVNSSWLKREPFRLTRDFEEYLFVEDTMDRRAPNTWITDQAISWIQGRGPQPLFLFVHYYDVHADYASLPEYESLFVTPYEGPVDGTAWQLATTTFEDDFLEMCHAEYDPSKCRIGTLENYLAVNSSVEKLELEDQDVQHLEQLYDAGIRQLDTELGRLLSVIEEEGLDQNGLVVITSDHGEEFMDHGRMDHFLTVYQEILHVPMIFRGRAIPEKLRIDTPVSLVDIAPTILSIAGLPVDEDIDGLDLMPLMTGEPSSLFQNRFLYGEAAGGLSYALMMDNIYPIYRSVRRGRYKLIHDSKKERSWLYDLTEDPGETRDISKEHPEVASQLLKEMMHRHSDSNFNPSEKDKVNLDSKDLEQLRALGYIR
ncbi:MAG: hypothetical protein CL917_16670 [Deltaproteobacteria bacterium]|nr:hypothetical protein [Deltaproteobacteria bacterium]